MAQPEHAAVLVRLARQDLDALVALSELPPIADAILGFHAQQAVEKGLKDWLAARAHLSRLPLCRPARQPVR